MSKLKPGVAETDEPSVEAGERSEDDNGSASVTTQDSGNLANKYGQGYHLTNQDGITYGVAATHRPRSTSQVVG